jgi:hypothetical protein
VNQTLRIMELQNVEKQLDRASPREKEERLERLAHAPVPQELASLERDARLSVLLRVWSGGVSAGKAIAGTTMEGPNTSELRDRWFRLLVDPRAGGDRFYAAGVKGAARWKIEILGQPVFFEGVPPSSLVREELPVLREAYPQLAHE